MEIEFQLTSEPIAEKIPPPQGWPSAKTGAWLEFRGIVRDEENGQNISALEYEAYPEMAEREIRRLLQEISMRYSCLAAKVIHRVGVIPVGETAIYVGIASPHRGEAIGLLAEFVDRLKQDAPIWKRRGISDGARLWLQTQPQQVEIQKSAAAGASHTAALFSLDHAISEIQTRCQPLPVVRVPLAGAFGRVLRETVCAPDDLPAFDRSTRDGYAILREDASETFRVVDTLHAADWKPRKIKPGEAVRVASGSALPCENLRVVMQENVERTGGQIRIVKREAGRNVSVRGEDLRAGNRYSKPARNWTPARWQFWQRREP